MLWSEISIPTLREAPAGIPTMGGRLLARAGYLRGEAHLFLAERSLDKIAGVIGQELDSPAPVDFLDGFRKIFRRCEIEYSIAESKGGAKFVVPCEAGEDLIARAGVYLADLSSAVSEPKPPAAADPEGDFAPEPFPTPNRKTIAELAEFTGLPETSHIKSIVWSMGMSAGGAPIMALLRGDHRLSETKLAHILETTELRPATPEEIREHCGAGAGSLGPVGLAGVRILADQALRGRRNMIAGANRDDYHLRNVTPGKDFAAEFFDLRQSAEGDSHDGEILRVERAVVLATLSNEGGSYSISPDRILWAAAEQHHDPDGLALPPAIAPFDVIVTLVAASSAAQLAAANNIEETAAAAGLEVLIDDRDERPGVKFKDADLIGVPWRVTIGKKLEQGMVEAVDRRSKQKTDVAAAEAVEFIRTRR